MNADLQLHVQGFLSSWIQGQNGPVYTPKGLAYPGTQWGSLRHTSNAAFLFAVYAKSSLATTAQRKRLTCFSHKQMGYILGDGGRSYVVGYGTNPPCRPHHRAASCPDRPAPCTWDSVSCLQQIKGCMLG
jgi:endoglucanase